MTNEIGPKIPPHLPVLETFRGVNDQGLTAIVNRTREADFVQMDCDLHEHAFGWWRYPLGSFRHKATISDLFDVMTPVFHTGQKHALEGKGAEAEHEKAVRKLMSFLFDAGVAGILDWSEFDKEQGK